MYRVCSIQKNLEYGKHKGRIDLRYKNVFITKDCYEIDRIPLTSIENRDLVLEF